MYMISSVSILIYSVLVMAAAECGDFSYRYYITLRTSNSKLFSTRLGKKSKEMNTEKKAMIIVANSSKRNQ